MLNHKLKTVSHSGMSLKYYIPFSLNMGFYFTNILNIETSNLCMDYINPNNQKRLNCIWELHYNGFSNREI